MTDEEPDDEGDDARELGDVDDEADAVDVADANDAADVGDARADFAAELAGARESLAADDLTAFHVGVVHADESVDVSFAQVADDPRQEGLQALSLLAAHLRVVARQAGVDFETVADDAVQLAGEVEELVDE